MAARITLHALCRLLFDLAGGQGARHTPKQQQQPSDQFPEQSAGHERHETGVKRHTITCLLPGQC